jgi:hypothetical protein
MKIETKKIKLDSLIIAKEDLETFIKIQLVKLSSNFFTKDYDDEKIQSIKDLVAAADEQLIEVKIVIQKANTNETHEDGNVNNHYIYKLSSLNRELSLLKELVRKYEAIEAVVAVKTKDTSKYNKELASKKVITQRNKTIATRMEELDIEISDIKQILTNFNKATEVEIQVHEGFEKYI